MHAPCVCAFSAWQAVQVYVHESSLACVHVHMYVVIGCTAPQVASCQGRPLCVHERTRTRAHTRGFRVHLRGEMNAHAPARVQVGFAFIYVARAGTRVEEDLPNKLYQTWVTATTLG